MSMAPAVLSDSLSYYLTGGAVASRPSAWQVRLHTASPGMGASNEVTDSGYARQAVTFVKDADGTYVANAADLNFGTASVGFVVTHITVWDSANAVALVIQRLTSDRTVSAGTQAVMATGELKIGGIA